MDKTEKTAKRNRLPGEIFFIAFLSAIALFGLCFAFDIVGPELKYSSPATFPLLASSVMLFASVFIWHEGLRLPAAKKEQADAQPTGRKIIYYLCPANIGKIALFVILYAVLLPLITFIPATLLFLLASLLIIGKTALKKSIIVSVAILAVIFLIFSSVFQVILP